MSPGETKVNEYNYEFFARIVYQDLEPDQDRVPPPVLARIGRNRQGELGAETRDGRVWAINESDIIERLPHLDCWPED